MSLINDALKRAKESQGQTPPPVAPLEKTGFRPVETAPSKGIPAWVWLVLIILLVGLGAFLIGQSTHKSTTETVVATEASQNPSQPVKATATEQASVVAAKPVVETVKATPAPAPVQSVAAPVAPVAPAPSAAQLKLQSIIYIPGRPSAMVNGKSLMVGDQISGFRVVKIQKNSVTLTGGGQTNVLALEEQ